MSVNDAHAILSKASKDLSCHWQELRSIWRDEAADNFEQRYIEPLEIELRKSKLAMEQLGALIAKIKSDCS